MHKKHFVLILTLLFAFLGNCLSQEYKITQVPYALISLDRLGFIYDQYNEVKNKKNCKINLMLINSYSGTNVAEAFIISVGADNEVYLSLINKDSAVYKDSIFNPVLFQDSFFNSTKLSGNYYTTSSVKVISHLTTCLVVSNFIVNNYIELECFEGSISDALNENKDFLYLKIIYNFFKEIFNKYGQNVKRKTATPCSR